MGTPDERRTKFLPDPYFHSDHLPESKLQYVAWLDLMGTTSMMEHSFEAAATNVCKLHLFVAQQEDYDQFSIYPMNDCLYIVSDSYPPLRRFLKSVFTDYAEVLASNVDRDSWEILGLAIPRAAIAYGHLYHPRDIGDSALADYQYASSILLGEPMTTAHRKESSAPPFGIVADASVHEEDGDIQWWEDENLAKLLFVIYDEYLRACEDHDAIAYPEDRMNRHRNRAQEYLVQ